MIYKISEATGKLIIIFLGFLLLYSALFIAIGASIIPILFYVSLLSTCIIFFINDFRERKFQKESFYSVGVFLLSIGITYLISNTYFDFSADGQWYHLNAILNLSNGWNPLYEEEIGEIWINHYAMGNWYGSTLFFEVFQTIESTKMYGQLIFLAMFFLLFGFLKRFDLPFLFNFVISFVAACNPIVIVQLFTNYNDGMIASMMGILLISIYLYFKEKTIIHRVLFSMSIIILSNIKFTAFGYGVIVVGTPILYMMLSTNWKSWYTVFKEKYLKYVVTAIIAFSLAIIFVGMTSYVTNTIDHGHPFYPLAGEGKQDIMTSNKPPALHDISRVKSFIWSVFSPSSDYMGGEAITYKNPFTIKDFEIASLGYADTRIGGFGPFYGLIFIATILLVFVSVIVAFKYKQWIFVSALIVFLLTVAINPEPWWMRYIPQLWLIPIIAMISIINKFKFSNWLVTMVLAVMVVNAGVMIGLTLDKEHDRQVKVEEAYKLLKTYSESNDVILDFQWSRGNEQRIKEQNIPYYEAKFYIENPQVCNSNVRVVHLPMVVCTEDQVFIEQMQSIQ